MAICNRGLKQILIDFSGWTSAHGLPHIGSAQSRGIRLFWTVVFMASMFVFTYQMVTLVNKYFNYPISVQTELRYEKLDFPAVTICPLNGVKKSLLPGTSNLSTTFDQDPFTDLARKFVAVRGATQSAGANSSTFASEYHFSTDSISTDKSVETMQERRAHGIDRLLIDKAYRNDWLDEFGYKYEDLILSCSYNTKDCNESEFETYYSPSYGYCLTFNKDGSKQSTRAGPLYGLRLLIRMHQKDYIQYAQTAGVRVAIHNNDFEPFVDTFGYECPPGMVSALGIKYVKKMRLPAPYGNCLEKPDLPYNFNSSYSVEGCYRSCLQDVIVKKCGCYEPTLGLFKVNAISCSDVTSPTQLYTNYKCIEKWSQSTNLIKVCSYCSSTCDEAQYMVTVSSALWPSEVYTPPECNNANLTKKYWEHIDQCINWYKENTLLIEAYYERMNYQIQSQNKDYTLFNMVSDTGGQLGLFLGVSFITCIEFLCMSVIMCFYCINRKVGDIPDPDDYKISSASDDTDDGSSSGSDPYSIESNDNGQPVITC